MDRKLTIADISRIAGVSKATVSRVLNNSEKVNEVTRQNILKIIEENNYQPSNLARALTKKRSHIIGVVIEDLANPFFTEIARGIESELHKNGYIMFLTSSNWDRDKEQDIVNKLYRHQIDGLLITPIETETPVFKMLKKSSLPVVLMNYRRSDPDQSIVSSDNIKGAEIGAKLLFDNQYREIICLKGFEHQTANDRVEGFYKEAERHREENRIIKLFTGINTREDGYNFAKDHADYFRTIIHSCGIFALNDFVAFGLIDGLLDASVSVPDKVAVLGYDDISFSERYRIPLSTIHQPKFRLGKMAAEELLEKINNRNKKASNIIIDPELVIRESCPLINNNR